MKLQKPSPKKSIQIFSGLTFLCVGKLNPQKSLIEGEISVNGGQTNQDVETCDYIISSEDSLKLKKCIEAQEQFIPIVKYEFISQSIQEGKLISGSKFNKKWYLFDPNDLSKYSPDKLGVMCRDITNNCLENTVFCEIYQSHNEKKEGIVKVNLCIDDTETENIIRNYVKENYKTHTNKIVFVHKDQFSETPLNENMMSLIDGTKK